MFLAIFLILFFLLVIYILLIPIDLYADTGTDQYYIRLRSLAKASIEKHEEELIRVNFKIAFLHFYFYPLKEINLSKKKKRVGGHETVNNRKKIGFNKFLKILKTFKIKSFIVDVDSGDCISNAKLYPVFGFLNYYNLGKYNVNFEGRSRMVIHMQNRPLHIIRSFINF